MENTAQIQGDNNVIIQGISESTITLNINGETKEINKQLSEFREIIESLHAKLFRVGENLYNLDDIEAGNFLAAIDEKHTLNSTLAKELVELFPDNSEIEKWINDLPEGVRKSWELQQEYLNDAKKMLQENFVWIIGWELRRLFAIGENRKPTQDEIDDYIHICLRCHRTVIQVVNYLLILKLRDEKKLNSKLPTDYPEIQSFFGVATPTFKSNRDLLNVLVKLFKEQGIEFPFPEMGQVDLFSDSSSFSKACDKLEGLPSRNPFGLGSCHTAEYNLAQVLKTFPFFTNIKSFTVKRIEYENVPHADPQYVKDFQVLENKSNYVRIDGKPNYSYSFQIKGEQTDSGFNLFPLVLDYNALVNASDFQIFLYQRRIGNSGLEFYNINTGAEDKLVFSGKRQSFNPMENQQKEDFEKKYRTDLVIVQFQDLMNTLLGQKTVFEPARVDDFRI